MHLHRAATPVTHLRSVDSPSLVTNGIHPKCTSAPISSSESSEATFDGIFTQHWAEGTQEFRTRARSAREFLTPSAEADVATDMGHATVLRTRLAHERWCMVHLQIGQRQHLCHLLMHKRMQTTRVGSLPTGASARHSHALTNHASLDFVIHPEIMRARTYKHSEMLCATRLTGTRREGAFSHGWRKYPSLDKTFLVGSATLLPNQS